MKKALYILLAAVLVIGLAACGGKNDTPGGETGSSTAEPGTDVAADPFDINGCVITRGQNAGGQMLSISRRISTTVARHCGKTMMIRDDSAPVAGAEILIGETNRAETARAKAELEGKSSAFVIRRYGNKLVILGTGDAVTTVAAEYFLDTLLPAVAEKGQLMLAADYAHAEDVPAVQLLENGTFRYTLVTSAAFQNSATMKCMQTVSNAVKALTGKTPVYAPDGKAADAARDAESREILIGATYYPQTAAFTAKLRYNEYGISMEGNKIVIYGFSDDSTEKATQLFVDLLNTADRGNLTVPATLTMKETDSAVKLDLPAYPSLSQKIVSLGLDSTMIYVTEATETAFLDYAAALERAGMKKYDENQLGTSRFYTYTAAKATVTAGYNPATRTVRIILDNTGTRPVSAADNAAVQKVCEPTLTQFRPELLANETGLSYIIRLEDGRFAIIDGGVNDYSDIDRLYDTLCAQNVRNGNPVIAAWFLTHAHADHYDTFLRFTEKYRGRFALETAVWNLPPKELASVDEWSRNFITSTIGSMAGTKVIYARTGQKFRFGSVSIDVWHTPDDLYPAFVNAQNDASVIYRMEIGGQSVMFLADADAQIATYMVERYGAALRSDFMQISHHGYSYSTAMPPLFRAIDPIVVLWPTSDEWYHEFQTNRGHNSDILPGKGRVVEAIAATHGTRTLAFPYTPVPNTLPTYRDGDLIYRADFAGAKYLSDLGWEWVDDLNARHTVPRLSLVTRGGVRGILLEGTAYSPLTVVCPDLLANAPVWTLTVQLTADTLGDGFGIWYNDGQPMEANSPRCIYKLKKAGTVALTLVNDRTAGVTRIYLDGVLAETLTNPSNVNGRIMLLSQNSKVFLSSLAVHAGDAMKKA